MPIPFEKLTYTDILHHQLAYGCFDEVGKSLFQEWDIVGFEKAVLGCGDNHFLYMAEKIKETPNLYGELNTTMPFLRFRDVGRILRTFKIKKNVEVTDNGKDNF